MKGACLGGEDGQHGVARTQEAAVALEGQVGAGQDEPGIHHLHLDIGAHLGLHLQRHHAPVDHHQVTFLQAH